MVAVAGEMIQSSGGGGGGWDLEGDARVAGIRQLGRYLVRRTGYLCKRN
jgi:hypothetical protein